MSRVSQLNDRDWLQDRYRQAGDSTIANELGCSKSTVRRARRRLGIESFRVGPRSEPLNDQRTIRVLNETFDEFAQIIDETVTQLRRDKQRHTPATSDRLALRVRNVHDAQRDPYAERQALIDLAALAMLCANTKPVPNIGGAL